jgi:hypothetical protein
VNYQGSRKNSEAKRPRCRDGPDVKLRKTYMAGGWTMFRTAILTSIAMIAVCNSQQAAAQTYRISCERFEGVRAQFAAHPTSPPDQKDRLIKKDDAISGLKLVLTVNGRDGSVTTFGNQNVGGSVKSFPVTMLDSREVISFVGTDPHDGSTNMLTVFPAQSRMIWTGHTNKIYTVDQIVLGKTFIGICTFQKLG